LSLGGVDQLELRRRKKWNLFGPEFEVLRRDHRFADLVQKRLDLHPRPEPELLAARRQVKVVDVEPLDLSIFTLVFKPVKPKRNFGIVVVQVAVSGIPGDLGKSLNFSGLFCSD